MSIVSEMAMHDLRDELSQLPRFVSVTARMLIESSSPQNWDEWTKEKLMKVNPGFWSGIFGTGETAVVTSAVAAPEVAAPAVAAPEVAAPAVATSAVV